MRLPLVRSIALGLLLLASCRKDNPADHVRSANADFDQGRYPEAIIEYRRALQLNEAGDMRVKLGDAYARTNQTANAIKEYIRAADLLPGNVDAQLRAGSALIVSGRFDEAKARAEKILETDPQSVPAQILRGNALAEL